MSSKARLNMEHGFMQSIIRNQVDRDNYDKEMKEKEKASCKSTVMKKSPKTKRPDQHTYLVPSARPKLGVCRDDDCVAFVFEYTDEYGDVSQLTIYKTDDINAIARQFGADRHMDQAMTNALVDFLNAEYSKRCGT